MNAKNILKLMETHAANARRCYPSDEARRAVYFTSAFGQSLARCGEQAGIAVLELASDKTNAPHIKDSM